jgi:hypothetical protein
MKVRFKMKGRFNMKRKHIGLLAIIGIAAFLFGPFPALAQVAPPLGTMKQFSVLGHSGVTGSAGAGTVVSGDVGSSPTATISNFPPSSVAAGFTVHRTNDLTVQQAHTDAIAAYNFLVAQGPGTVRAAQLDGAVITSGIYSFAGGAADLAANGTLTLNGPGVFIFQVGSALTANVNSNVNFIGGADPCSVFWRVGTSATLNGITFGGNVIADASITVGVGSNVTGRTIAGTGATGAVTMAGGPNTIGGCASGCPVITVNPATLPDGTVGTAYNATISASSGAAQTASGGGGGAVTARGIVVPFTFAVKNGALPTGLLLNSTTGAITRTPTVAGTFNFTITATDTSTGCIGSRDYTVVIAAAAAAGPADAPTLDFVGLTILMVLLAGAGLFVMKRF